jgi:RNA polymerase sigma-70 factor (ECF subfamily)
LSLSPEQYSDTALLDLYKKSRDNKWLGFLFERYSMLVFGVCMKYLKNVTDAQDATQQVFEKVILEISKYEVPFFKSWIYSIAKNHCLMQIRNKSHKPVLLDEFPEAIDSEANENSLLKEQLQQDQTEALLKAIDALGPEQKNCITLFYLKKQSYKEIEKTTGYTFQQVKSHIQNGKRNLRLILEQQYNALNHD